MNTFQIRGSIIELHKLLKASGLAATGGQAKLIVSQGMVRVNGTVETRKGAKLKAGDRIEFEGQEVLLTAEPAAGPGQGRIIS